ncbi:MAG: Flp family type IVb pilin [Roseovarius sp.]
MTMTRKTIRLVARSFARDEDGATAIEYGLFAALVGAVIVGTIATLGGQTNTGFTTMSDELTAQGIDAPAAN